MRKAKRAISQDQEFQALTVSVAGERVAIPANDVAQVISNPAVTRIPHSPEGLLGVANLRGAVIPIVSLASLLGSGSVGSSSRRVVVVGKDQLVGLTVDDVASLERSDQLRAATDPVRILDIESLLAAQFGTLTKPVVQVAASAFVSGQTEAARPVSTRTFFSFEISGQEFGLPLASVQEVVAVPENVTVVPRTDDAMLGAISLRNHLLPLVSLGTLLGLGAPVSVGRIVVSLIGGVRVGLVVDALKAIVRASEDQIDPVPLVLTRGHQEAHIQSICRLDEGRRLMSVLSTDHLLEEGLAQRLAGQSDNEEEIMEDTARGAATEQIVIFQLADQHYGLPVDSVVEVVAPPDKLTRLPKAPKFVEGVMNLRGQIVPVIDQRRRFEAAAPAVARKARIIVVRIGKGFAGFVVDSVSEVLRVDVAQLRASPELTSKKSKVIDRIANLEQDGRMILLVDPQELLDQAEQDMIAAMHGNASAPS